MSQPDLFSHSPRYPETPGHRGVDTSVAAAEHIAPHTGRLHRQILALLKTGPRLRDSICEALNITTPTACGRLRELELAGLVEKGATVKGRSGRPCHVYQLTKATP